MCIDSDSIRKGIKKFVFFVKHFIDYYMPDSVFAFFFFRRIRHLSEEEKAEAVRRAEYYVKIPVNSNLPLHGGTTVKAFTYPFGKEKKFSSYFFDLYRYIRLFPSTRCFFYRFGDVDVEMPFPGFVKARPVTTGTSQSVICKLNSARHFFFVSDSLAFREKANRVVFRNVVRSQPQRTRLIGMYYNHPLCDVGRINQDVTDGHPEYIKPYLAIRKQLQYKFICCIEGHDVATNLKWVMSSNSLAVMPRPKVESWFMEGTLIGDYHYVEIREDYADLIEKVTYYIEHPDKAEQIVAHAHEYVHRFRNPRVEDYTSWLVVKKYFEQTASQSE